MRIRLAVPDDLNQDETKAALDAALESVARADEALLRQGRIPTAEKAISAGRVRWKPEPPGDEHFDLASTVIGRGWGDCDDLAPWHAASLRATGEDPEAYAFVRPSGPSRWHALVQRSNGTLEDPSRAAGMGGVGGDEYGGPLWPEMFPQRLSLASFPLRSGWAGRVDIPSTRLPLSYSLLSAKRNPRAAIMNAIRGCSVVGDDMYAEDQLRLMGLHDILAGQDPRDVCEAIQHLSGDQGVGFGFDTLTSLAPAAASLIPGGSLAMAALPLAQSLLKGGGGGGGAASPAAMPPMAAPGGGAPPGACMHLPGGPIIIRF